MNIPLKDLPNQKHTKIPIRNNIDYKPFEEKKYKYIDNLLNDEFIKSYFNNISINESNNNISQKK
tara:strand:+ start:11459 stop:11653 length:195 start_codon:yes stop_codon:yes gene_type:complete